MGKLSLAFKVLFDSQLAQRIQQCLNDDAAPPAAEPPKPEAAPEKPEARSEAVTLLSALQREARLVDFVMEPLEDYTDAQVGAAVRDVQRDSRKVLERLFAVKAVTDQAEGSRVDLAGGDQGRIRRTGDGDLDGATQGQLVHHGWQATHCQLPDWTGSADARLIIAPAEVEVR